MFMVVWTGWKAQVYKQKRYVYTRLKTLARRTPQLDSNEPEKEIMAEENSPEREFVNSIYKRVSMFDKLLFPRLYGAEIEDIISLTLRCCIDFLHKRREERERCACWFDFCYSMRKILENYIVEFASPTPPHPFIISPTSFSILSHCHFLSE